MFFWVTKDKRGFNKTTPTDAPPHSDHRGLSILIPSIKYLLWRFVKEEISEIPVAGREDVLARFHEAVTLITPDIYFKICGKIY